MEDHRELLPDYFEGFDIELDDYFEEAQTLKTFACDYLPADDLEREFGAVCQRVYDFGHMLLIIEEAPLVCRANYMPPTFGKIIRTGRHRDIDVLWTADPTG